MYVTKRFMLLRCLVKVTFTMFSSVYQNHPKLVSFFASSHRKTCHLYQVSLLGNKYNLSLYVSPDYKAYIGHLFNRQDSIILGNIDETPAGSRLFARLRLHARLRLLASQ